MPIHNCIVSFQPLAGFGELHIFRVLFFDGFFFNIFLDQILHQLADVLSYSESCWCMTQGVGHEPRDSLQGNKRGWFRGVIPSSPAENQQGIAFVVFWGVD